MKRTLAMLAGAAILTTLCASAMANARDADGSRMQARQITVGSSASDRLNPPGDSVDWHYFKVSDAGNLSVSVKSSPADAPARIRITNAVGKSIASTATSNGKSTTSRRFDPGVYYISVSAGRALSYDLSVR